MNICPNKYNFHNFQTYLIKLHFFLMLTSASKIARGFLNYSFTPVTDILTFKNGYQVDIELPGVNRDDITIDCADDTLTIHALKKDPITEDKKRTRSEREFGSVTQSFHLPNNIETEKLDAVLSNGVLTVTIPKKESSKVEVKVK